MATCEWIAPRVNERVACLCCGGRGSKLDLRTDLCVGFGLVRVTRDGEDVHYHCCVDDIGCDIPADRFEAMASRDPDHDWRIDFNSPLRQNIYQRQGIGEWYVVETGQGFA